jgi:hypothetical protein
MMRSNTCGSGQYAACGQRGACVMWDAEACAGVPAVTPTSELALAVRVYVRLAHAGELGLGEPVRVHRDGRWEETRRGAMVLGSMRTTSTGGAKH